VTTPTSERTVVVGGGIIGLACAHHLVQAGHAVTIVDRAAIGAGCSHANLGYICPSHVLPLNEPGAIGEGLRSLFDPKAPFRVKPQLRLGLYRWMLEFARRCTHDQMVESGRKLQPLLDASLEAYLRVFEVLPSDGQWKRSGLAYAFQTGAALADFAKVDALVGDTYGIESRRIEGSDLGHFDPALRDDLAGAFVYEGDGFVRPDALIGAWRDHLAGQGVEFEEHRAVTEVRIGGGRVLGLGTARGEMGADHYVFATGAWSPQLASQLGCRIPIEPGKGYSLTMSRPSICPTHPMLFPEHRIGIAPFDDGFRIGSMMEFAGYDTTIPERRIAQLTASAAPYLREPTGAERLETWYGWRPMTWDSLPIVGRVPRLENAVLATGHNMLGVALAAGTGRLVTELITEQPTQVDLTPFSPGRFAR
jgi:D-amino-acid dehydrogenase